jgi:cell division protein FtsL
MKENRASGLISALLSILILIVIAGAAYYIVQSIQQSAQQAVAPFQQANSGLQTQVSQLLHPTPTVIPDPVTYITEVRSLARLETIQYSIEKVITAEVGQGTFGFLFGDKLLFVAHGTVIAGIDMEKIGPQDLRLENGVLVVKLPAPEIFVATLDNDKSYVYDRDTGALTAGDINLETTARQAAEQEIRKAAEEDGILKLAQQNAETYLSKFFAALGYQNTIFESAAGD